MSTDDPKLPAEITKLFLRVLKTLVDVLCSIISFPLVAPMAILISSVSLLATEVYWEKLPLALPRSPKISGYAFMIYLGISLPICWFFRKFLHLIQRVAEHLINKLDVKLSYLIGAITKEVRDEFLIDIKDATREGLSDRISRLRTPEDEPVSDVLTPDPEDEPVSDVLAPDGEI